MNAPEQKMISLLSDLKENHDVIGVKAEFETEAMQLEELQKLKEIASAAGLELTLKISGCGSVRDISEANALGVTSIVAPMIESTYAAKKFVKTIENIFSVRTKLFLNIETLSGFNCIDEILSSDFSTSLTGIVFGRTDMTNCLGVSKDNVNNETILKYAQELAQKAQKLKKEFIVGGGVSALSIPFFRQLQYLTKFETRKVIFDAKKTLANKNLPEGIEKAIEFELMWIKSRKNCPKDNERIAILQSRLLKN